MTFWHIHIEMLVKLQYFWYVGYYDYREETQIIGTVAQTIPWEGFSCRHRQERRRGIGQREEPAAQSSCRACGWSETGRGGSREKQSL